MFKNRPPNRAFIGVLAAGLFALAGCGREIGRDFDPDQADRLIIGTSTLADATALLGEPFRVRGLFGGKIAKWWYLRDAPGMTETVLLEIQFGPDGRMRGIIREIEKRGPDSEPDAPPRA